MKVLEIPLDTKAWPRFCCKCGSEAYAFHIHTENVVVWTVISVTSYRKISVAIPVCNSCARQHFLWYGGALLLVVAAFGVAGQVKAAAAFVGQMMAVALAMSVAMVLKGMKSAPINILGYSPEENSIKVKIKSDRATRELMSDPRSKLSSHSPVRKVYLYALLLVMFFVVGGAWLVRLLR